MRVRNLLSPLAVLAVMSPLAATGLPACDPGPHCPMAAALGEEAPCHGAAMQEDDCCLTAPGVELAEVPPVVAAAASGVDRGAPAPLPERIDGSSGACEDAPSPPLYRLFRALLI